MLEEKVEVKALEKGAIFAPRVLPIERVEVPEWRGHVYVRTLSGAERDAFESATVRVRSGKTEAMLDNLRGRLVALCTCDENGRRLFVDDDAAEIGRLNGVAVDRVFQAAQRLNGMSSGAVEEARGN